MVILRFSCKVVACYFSRMARGKTDGSGKDLPGRPLPVTHWSMVFRARDRSEASLNAFCADYWEPLVAWLLRQNYALQDAKDLVQGFFASSLKRDFLAGVSPDKGRFRTFLLTAFKNYLCDQHDRATAAKRGGGQKVESLDETDSEGRPLQVPSAADLAPDEEYDRACARMLLGKAMGSLSEEYARKGQAVLFAALEPLLYRDETAPRCQQVAERFQMTEGAIKKRVFDIRKRFEALFREEVRQTLPDDASPEDVDEEIRQLMRLFRR